HWPADEVTAQARDDAEAAAVIAALADLQIGVVTRRELDALWRHQINERIVRTTHRRGNDFMHGTYHLLISLGTGNTEHLGVHLENVLGVLAHAAGDDDLAVLADRLANGVEGFLLGAVD